MTRILNLIPRTSSFVPGGTLLDRFIGEWDLPALFEEGKSWVPAFDISENEKEYVVTAEIPGIDARDLDVTLSDGILTVKGEKKQEKEDKGENYHRVERSYGSFHRSFRIPEKVATEKVDASYKDGVLKLTLLKAETSEPKKIEVK
ncbi:MAG: Hsp20/alpha crystallin family protein [Desulfatiglandaceae bacterium]